MSVARLCASIDDARRLRLELLPELRRMVPFDAFAWLLTDPETEVGTAPIADVPCLSQLPDLIRLKYATVLNRWTHQAGPLVRLADVTGGRLERSLLWRDLLRAHGVTDIASLVFRDGFGCWSFLDLWRTGGTFTDTEAQLLRTHLPVVTGALRRCAARTFAAAGATGAVDRTGPVVLVLSGDLGVRAQTPETAWYLQTLVPPEEGHEPVPAAAYNVGAQLLAVEAGVDDHPPVARVHLAGRDWLTLRAARIGEDIAVSIEPASSTERLGLLRRASGLTRREAELLDLLTSGVGTHAIAAQMFLSEHTVQDHLKAIFAKTGTSSRKELLARVGFR